MVVERDLVTGTRPEGSVARGSWVAWVTSVAILKVKLGHVPGQVGSHVEWPGRVEVKGRRERQRADV